MSSPRSKTWFYFKKDNNILATCKIFSNKVKHCENKPKKTSKLLMIIRIHNTFNTLFVRIVIVCFHFYLFFAICTGYSND